MLHKKMEEWLTGTIMRLSFSSSAGIAGLFRIAYVVLRNGDLVGKMNWQVRVSRPLL